MITSNKIWPLKVVLNKVKIEVKQWVSWKWELEGVYPSNYVTENTSDNIQKNCIVYLELHKDELESYRLNLDTNYPKIFVICNEDENGDCNPIRVSADQSDAAACLETDTPVFECSMPDAIACWIEAFIAINGEPVISALKRKVVDVKDELHQTKQRG